MQRQQRLQKAADETIAIYYDGELISVPNVDVEITDGQAVIEGNMSYEEAEQLASTIRIGGLSVELEEIRSNVVGAQLGEEAISTSLMAGAIGLAIVFVFMCVVYLLPGFASSLALVIYTGLILVLLNAFDITLTLPGYRGYHSWYRYGGRCECNYLCACKRGTDGWKICKICA